MSHSSPAHALAEVTQSNGIELQSCGIVFPEAIPLEKWNAVGDLLCQANNSVGFWVGDWLNYGERTWGEKYRDAMDLTGFEYQTLRDYAYVADKVHLSLRNDNLTFEHHKKVAPLEPDEQRKWLKLAEQRGMSTRLLSASIIAGYPLKELPDPQPGIPNHVPYVNRLISWWRKKSDVVMQDISAERREEIRRDLKPVVDIYHSLGEDKGGEQR